MDPLLGSDSSTNSRIKPGSLSERETSSGLSVTGADGGLWQGIDRYISRQSSSLVRYFFEQILMVLVGWVPTIVGIGLSADSIGNGVVPVSIW